MSRNRICIRRSTGVEVMETKMKISRNIRCLLAGAALSFSGSTMAATQMLCVWDILGAGGDVYSMMKDYKLGAARWGANLELKPYTDERISAEDFKAGQCDAVVLTGLRARQFNAFTGSLD